MRIDSTEHTITVDQTIRFNECPYGKDERIPTDIQRIRVEQSFVTYEETERIVRYAGRYTVDELNRKWIVGEIVSES